MKQVLNGSEIVLECLKEQGVDTVFGYPGGAILNIYDELYKQSDKIHHVLTSHEQGASHAADGYARATGKVGVCMATSGPGATNLVTGLATAYMDSIPVVAITANVGVSLLGKDSFQEIDIKGVTMPVTKHTYIVTDIEKLADTIREAFQIAQSGRKGPVLVDITKDVTAAKTYFESMEPAVIHPVCETIKEKSVKEAIEMIEEAKQPYVLLGGGCTLSDASEQVREFVKKIDAPVCDTLMGKGVFPGEDPAYTGMLGMHGTKTSNIGVSQSDLLIAIGTRFSDRVYGNAKTFASRAKIIQIDIDPAEVNKNILIDTAIIGDVKAVLTILNRRLSQQHHEAWMQEIQDMKAKYPMTYHQERLSGPGLIEKIYELTEGDAIITTEVGQHQMWAAQYYKYERPRQFLTSGGLGTMGYGLGAAIGAKCGCPDKVVVNIAGDGCFRMNMNEIATATRSEIPVIEVVVNNHVLGMVRQWQNLFYGERYSSTTLYDKVDFVKLAEAMGAKAKRVETIIGDVKAVLTILNRRLSQQHHEAWMQEIQDMKAKYPMTYHQERLSGPGLIEKIYELTEGDAIITTEVGQHQMWAAQYYKYERPRQFLTSGGLGTMGYGLGAAIGAKCGCPDKVVVNIAGDGCFRMNMNEIATATRSEIPVIEVVVNNHVLGMVRQWQNLFYGERYSSTTLYDKVDFVKLAEAMGAKAKRVETIEEFEAAFKEAVASNEPYLLDCIIDSDDKVWPMVAPGGSISDAFNEEDLEKQKQEESK